MLGMAERGDNTNVDMLVGDIYGGSYEKIGLKATTIASSFGKVFMKQTEFLDNDGQAPEGNGNEAPQNEEAHDNQSGQPMGNGNCGRFKPEDISRSLLYMVRYEEAHMPLLTPTDISQ